MLKGYPSNNLTNSIVMNYCMAIKNRGPHSTREDSCNSHIYILISGKIIVQWAAPYVCIYTCKVSAIFDYHHSDLKIRPSQIRVVKHEKSVHTQHIPCHCSEVCDIYNVEQ